MINWLKGLYGTPRHNLDAQSLHEAVRNREYELLEKLARARPLHELDRNNETALDLAARLGDLYATQLLLGHGAQPTPQACHSQPTATLCNAIEGDNVEIVNTLLKRGCNPNLRVANDSCYTFWHVAVLNKDAEVMRCLLDNSPESVKEDNWRESLLQFALKVGAHEIVEILLQYEISIHKRDKYGRSALFHAFQSRDARHFKSLLAHGVDPNSRDKSDQCLLHLPDLLRKPKFVSLLVSYGAQVNAYAIVDGIKRTPLHVAVAEICASAEILLRHGADVGARDSQGRTALHLAVLNKNCKLLKDMLLRGSASIDVKDDFGRTAFSYLDCGNHICVWQLLEFGANPSCPADHGVFEVLRLYLVKRRVARLGGDFSILATINASLKLKEFRNRCELELNRMRETTLCGDVTYCEFLQGNKRTLHDVVKRPEVRKIFQKQSYCEIFPLYANILSHKFLIATNQRSIDDPAVERPDDVSSSGFSSPSSR